MFGILISSLFSALGWVFRSFVIKFIVMFGIFFVVSEILGAFASYQLIPSSSSINTAFGGFPSFFYYLLNAFRIDYGISVVIAAMASRFIIRRIPLIG